MLDGQSAPWMPLPHLGQWGTRVSLLDISQLHPLASGNKLFKLAPNLQAAIDQGYPRVLSFGGAYSNHIYALAASAAEAGLQSIGIIRGEPAYADNPTLRAARHWGMQLHFVDRQTYRRRHDADYLQALAVRYPETLIIPEGGSNRAALAGCQQLARLLNRQVSPPVDCIAVPCGSGGTLAGLAAGARAQQQVLGFAVVRDKTLQEKIKRLQLAAGISGAAEYQLIAADYGGYARFGKAQLDFVLHWLQVTGILLDPVYTVKMCQRLTEMLRQGYFAGQHICLIHTGGLQGWQGMKPQVIKLGGQAAWRCIARQHQQDFL